MKKLIIVPLMLLLTACTHKIVPPGEDTRGNLSETMITGRQAFMDKCHRCHPNGMGGLGPSIVNKPGFLIRFQVRAGLGTMPSFDKNKLPKEDLRNLISYIKEE